MLNSSSDVRPDVGGGAVSEHGCSMLRVHCVRTRTHEPGRESERNKLHTRKRSDDAGNRGFAWVSHSVCPAYHTSLFRGSQTWPNAVFSLRLLSDASGCVILSWWPLQHRQMSDDDDFAMAMFEMQDTAHTRRKQEETENTETWWIVLHSRVAVRPAPTTEGKPVCVLPQGAVVRAKTVRRVNGTRWVMISDDDVPRLVKKKKKAAAEGQEEAPPPAPGCCMMIESPTAGQLLMVAPKEFDWEQVRAVPPRCLLYTSPSPRDS